MIQQSLMRNKNDHLPILEQSILNYYIENSKGENEHFDMLEEQDFHIDRNKVFFKIIKELRLKKPNYDFLDLNTNIKNSLENINETYIDDDYFLEVLSTNRLLSYQIKHKILQLKGYTKFRKTQELYRISLSNANLNNNDEQSAKLIAKLNNLNVKYDFYSSDDESLEDSIRKLQQREIVLSKAPYLTGVNFIDKKIKTMLPDELLIIYGQGGVGKTTLILTMCLNIIKNSNNTILFESLEMSKEQVLFNIFKMATVSTSEIIRKLLIDNFELTLSDFNERFGKRLVIKDMKGTRTNHIKAHIDKIAQNTGKPPIVIIDSLTRILPAKNVNEKLEKQRTVIEELDQIKQSVACPIILIHHTNKSGEDFNGAQEITDYADFVIKLEPLTRQCFIPRWIKTRRLETMEEQPCCFVLENGTCQEYFGIRGLEKINEHKIKKTEMIFKKE